MFMFEVGELVETFPNTTNGFKELTLKIIWQVFILSVSQRGKGKELWQHKIQKCILGLNKCNIMAGCSLWVSIQIV